MDDFLRISGSQFTYRGQSVRLRGMNFKHASSLYTWNAGSWPTMYAEASTEQEYERLSQWGGNHVRVPVSYHWWLPTAAVPTARPADAWRLLDQEIAWAKKHRMWVYLNLMVWPGADGSNQAGYFADADFWASTAHQNSVVAFWEMIAEAYRDEPTVFGYDLLNEPSPPSQEVYRQYMQRCSEAVWAKAPNQCTIIKLSSANWNAYPAITGGPVAYSYHPYPPCAGGGNTPRPTVPDGAPNIVGEFGERWFYPDGHSQGGGTVACGGGGEWTQAAIQAYEAVGDHWSHFVMRERGPREGPGAGGHAFGVYTPGRWPEPNYAWNGANRFANPWNAMIGVVQNGFAVGSVRPL